MTTTKPIPALFPVFSLLLSATLWGVIWYPLRLLEAAGLSGLWTTLASYGAALLLGLLAVIARRSELRHQPLALLILAVSAGWCNVAFILAVLEGTVVRVLLLFYLSPIWAVLLAWLFLGERLSRQASGVFALAIIGALVMLWDPVIGLPWPSAPGDWLAVSSGFAFAVSNVMTRQIATGLGADQDAYQLGGGDGDRDSHVAVQWSRCLAGGESVGLAGGGGVGLVRHRHYDAGGAIWRDPHAGASLGGDIAVRVDRGRAVGELVDQRGGPPAGVAGRCVDYRGGLLGGAAAYTRLIP